MAKEPKKFIVSRAISHKDASKKRDENIGKVLDEDIKREYSFKMNPSLISDNPIVLIFPKSDDTDYYWRDMIEAVSSLSEEISRIVETDSPKGTMDENMKDKICIIGKLMGEIVRSESWSNDSLNEEDKNKFNEIIEKVKFN